MDETQSASALCPDWAQPAVEKLLLASSRHFDICRDTAFAGEEIPARADFHSRGEKYVLTKKAKLWAVECHEYLFFFAWEEVLPEHLDRVTRVLAQAERELVEPHSEHMYTYLSAVILTRGAGAESCRRLRRFRQRKNYRFSLYGWSQARVAMVELGQNKILSNADGKDLRKTLRKILR